MIEDRDVLFRTLFSVVLGLLPCTGWPQVVTRTAPSTAPLSLEEVVKLAKGGLSEEVIVTRIKQNGKPFDLSTEELLELKNIGITDNIIKFLLDPSHPYAPPPPPVPVSKNPEKSPDPVAPGPPAKIAKDYPADAHARQIPAEPGLYALMENSPSKVDVKMLLGEVKGPGLGKVLMKKGKALAYLVGSKSKVRFPNGSPLFYMRLPEGRGIEEIVLVALDGKESRRELHMGPPGPKQELEPDAVRRFDSLEVGTGLFRLSVTALTKGEYMFFMLGSAEPPKGSYGKGFDFGIDAPRPQTKQK